MKVLQKIKFVFFLLTASILACCSQEDKIKIAIHNYCHFNTDIKYLQIDTISHKDFLLYQIQNDCYDLYLSNLNEFETILDYEYCINNDILTGNEWEYNLSKDQMQLVANTFKSYCNIINNDTINKQYIKVFYVAELDSFVAKGLTIIDSDEIVFGMMGYYNKFSTIDSEYCKFLYYINNNENCELLNHYKKLTYEYQGKYYNLRRRNK